MLLVIINIVVLSVNIRICWNGRIGSYEKKWSREFWALNSLFAVLMKTDVFALPKVPLYLFKIMEEKRVNILWGENRTLEVKRTNLLVFLICIFFLSRLLPRTTTWNKIFSRILKSSRCKQNAGPCSRLSVTVQIASSDYNVIFTAAVPNNKTVL